MTAEREAAMVGRMKVKPLVWERHWPGCYTVKSMKADDNGCDVVYSAEKSNVGGFIVNTVTKPGYFRCWIDFGAEFHSINEAKAAAQADYEARILPALEPQPITECPEETGNNVVGKIKGESHE